MQNILALACSVAMTSAVQLEHGLHWVDQSKLPANALKGHNSAPASSTSCVDLNGDGYCDNHAIVKCEDSNENGVCDHHEGLAEVDTSGTSSIEFLLKPEYQT